MMKHLFVLNPRAGSGTGFEPAKKHIDTICRSLNLDYAVECTEKPFHAAQIVRRYAASGVSLRIYAGGGDGTLNEVVHGAAEFPAAEVAHYPLGTGNDFIRMFGENVKLFCDLEALIRGKAHPVDLITAGGRFSLNVFSCGFDAQVPIEMRKFKWFLRFGTQMPYNLGVVSSIMHGLSGEYEISIDGKDYSGNYLMIAVMNGRYYGGGFNPAPKALPHDGLFDIILVKRVTVLGLARMIGPYAKGSAEDLPVCTCLRGRELTFRAKKVRAVNFDGESDLWTEGTVRILPGGLRFVLPEALSFDMLQQRLSASLQ